MPITIPPFSQFQAPMIPLRGLWNHKPPEGDRFISAEIDWLAPGVGNAVQIQVGGNSPVPLSQIVALYVDNARCGADVTFLFGDSGFVLIVPAYAEGLYPVLTNALMFYVTALLSVASDITVVQVLNSLPPPIPVQLGQQQQANSSAQLVLTTNGSTQVVPTTVSGTVNGFIVSFAATSAATAGNFVLRLIDGSGSTIWVQTFTVQINSSLDQTIPVSGLKVRFTGGIQLTVSFSSNITSGNTMATIYYSVP